MDASALQNLITALENAADDKQRVAANVKIVQKAVDYGRKQMRERVPRAHDHSTSGSAWSKPENGPAADNVPTSKPHAAPDGTVSAKVGWTLSDDSEYFYMKFVNWGTLRMPPRDFVQPTATDVQNVLPEIAEEEYNKVLDQNLGRFE